MGDLVFTSQTKVEVGPADLFDLFGSGDRELGWLFGSEAAALRPGGLVRLSLPIGGLSDADGTARIQSVAPFRRILLAHESPWSGYIDCRISPGRSGGSQVRVTVSISQAEISRLGAGFGLAVSPPPNGHISVGLLTSLSGSNGIFGRSTVNCAQLAIDELNADGGVLGRQVSLSVADDATNPVVGQISMERLLRTPNLSAVIGYHNSATFAVTSGLAIDAGIPYLYTPVSEPGGHHPLLFRLGGTPLEQQRFALPRLARETGGTRWFIAGNDYTWPRAIAATAKPVVEGMGGTIAGRGFLPIGTRRFEPIIEAIRRSGAEHIISGFVGQDQIRFEQACVAHGLRDSTRTFAPFLDDVVVEHLGDSAAGVWNVLGYFEGLDTTENRDFLSRYKVRFGENAAPVSAAAEAVYEATHRWARACVAGRGVDASAVVHTLRDARFEGPRRRTSLASPDRMLLGEATSTKVRVLDKLPSVHSA